MQTTDTILLVRPSAFRRNEETAVNNHFQQEGKQMNVQELALAEFNNFINLLKTHGIRTIVVENDTNLDTPDCIFPNNVISFHQGETAILYPMFAPNRREERNLNYLGALREAGIGFEKIKDYSIYEEIGRYMEGTGVLVLDRVHKIAYCSLSERAHSQLVELFCEEIGYRPVIFEALHNVDGKMLPIYHTNVMLSVGTNFCVICWDSIPSTEYRKMLQKYFEETNKTIIAISKDQLDHFAGNILEVHSRDGQPLICMSTQAFENYTEEQIGLLEQFGKIIHAPISTIEQYGGGSVRCMMAEVFY
ncbi:citrulline utilization hydrolase CtlX [Sphingobacterium lumbrici]|uniref:citrulline utilization hydrolase CtlX n=1 Tax=Sphingobacterium lumbrici TaxID=2559600 RepID=UPI0011272BF5|nr:arginine deiminase-related protein [Sphingobacterium lumbrici]